MIVERRDPSTLGLALDALGPWLAEMGPVAVLDLETTGIAPGYDRILEFGCVRFHVDRDGRVTPGPRWSTLEDPDAGLVLLAGLGQQEGGRG